MSLRLLVTYGTLMRAFGRHDDLGVNDDFVFVSRCRWSGRLFDLGAYPGAVPGTGTVYGELFRVQTARAWDVLDRYEGYDPANEASSLFVRRTVSLNMPENRTAWVYWYNGAVEQGERVPSGDWLVYTGRTDSR